MPNILFFPGGEKGLAPVDRERFNEGMVEQPH
jgi:hypothetical protein